MSYSEFEILNIQRYSESFFRTYDLLTSDFNTEKIKNLLEKANENFSNYIDSQNDAIKSTEDAIAEAFNGSAGIFFSKQGINEIFNQIITKYQTETSNILNDYFNCVNEILASLPVVGLDPDLKQFEQTMYEGDQKYTAGNLGSEISGGDYLSALSTLSKINSLMFGDENKSIFIHGQKEYKTDDNIKVLGINAITDKNVEKIICSNVQEIKAFAFKGCDKLKFIQISNKIKKLNINCFRGISKECLIAFENSEKEIENINKSNDWLEGRRVIFDYNGNDNSSVIFKKKIQPKPKLSADEKFLKKYSRYKLSIDNLNYAYAKNSNPENKDLQLMYSLISKSKEVLESFDYFEYGCLLDKAMKIAYQFELDDIALDIGYGLVYLDSSGFRMKNSEEDPKQTYEAMCYHPKTAFGCLCLLIDKNNLSDNDITNGYKNSQTVRELEKLLIKPYYSVKDSIALLLEAKENPECIFYPCNSDIGRRN